VFLRVFFVKKCRGTFNSLSKRDTMILTHRAGCTKSLSLNASRPAGRYLQVKYGTYCTMKVYFGCTAGTEFGEQIGTIEGSFQFFTMMVTIDEGRESDVVLVGFIDYVCAID